MFIVNDPMGSDNLFRIDKDFFFSIPHRKKKREDIQADKLPSWGIETPKSCYKYYRVVTWC